MATLSLKAIRDELTFEQQARFDLLYEQQQKKLGTATVLSLPLLGTFGVEQFYLGNGIAGILRLLFSFTLIPTFSALFDIVTGDLKRQVDFANLRIARRLAKEVVVTTPRLIEPLPQSPVALAAADALAEQVANPATPVAEVATSAAIAAVATVTADGVAEASAAPAPPAATVEAAEVVAEVVPAAPAEEAAAVATDVAHEQDVATTATFTATSASSTWEAGMAQPVTANDSATATAGYASSAIAEVDQAAVESSVPAPSETHLVAEAQPSADAEAAVASPAAPEVGDDEAETGALASEGVLVFLEDPDAATVAQVQTRTTVTPEATVDAVSIDQAQASAAAVDVHEATQVTSQHFHDGKLVAQASQGTSLTGEINRLIIDRTHEDIVGLTETAASPGWVDVSALQGSPGAASPAPATPGAAASAMQGPTGPDAGGIDSGTGNGGPTNVPGGGVGDPPGNVPGGGIGTGGTDVPGGGVGGPPPPPIPTDGDTPRPS